MNLSLLERNGAFHRISTVRMAYLWPWALLLGARGLEECRTPELQFASEAFLVTITPLEGQALDGQWLSAWTRSHSDCLRWLFFRHGALLFRGFHVPDATAFERVALSLVPNLEKVYLGTSPRSAIENTSYVFTAADFEPHRAAGHGMTSIKKPYKTIENHGN